MSDLMPAIEKLEQERATQRRAVGETERAINTLLRLAGQPERYAATTDDDGPRFSSIKGDTFYGRPLATVVKEYLLMRRKSGDGPAAVAEIYAALKQGGFLFGTDNEENAKRGLRISLTKNVAFHKLPNGTYGLSEWYPSAKASKATEDAEDEALAGDRGEVEESDPGEDAEDPPSPRSTKTRGRG